MSVESSASISEFATGLGILLVAQLLSAYMGAFVEDTYAQYGANWTENLFYSHFFSLPLFLPLFSTLQQQYARLASTSPLDLQQLSLFPKQNGIGSYGPATETIRGLLEGLPSGILFLLTNAVTQLACISGVNLLSAKSSAVTVTIVLNIRKLVSFIFSTILFGHHLSAKMILGAALVFGSGALYGWETSWRLPQQRKQKAMANGSTEKKKK